MSEYKRLTKNFTGTCFCNNSVDCKIPCHECYYKKVYDQLTENGILIELPRIIHPNDLEWFVQYQYETGVIDYKVFDTKEKAEKY